MLPYIRISTSDFIEAVENLTNEEVGNLVLQMVEYARSGDTKSYLRGNERFLFPIFRTAIDRDIKLMNDNHNACLSEAHNTYGRN